VVYGRIGARKNEVWIDFGSLAGFPSGYVRRIRAMAACGAGILVLAVRARTGGGSDIGQIHKRRPKSEE
jgi:hypothetical protein